jgi:hypothetical protein
VRIADRGARSLPVAAAIVAEVEAEWAAHVGPDRMDQLRELLAELCEITDPYR